MCWPRRGVTRVSHRPVLDGLAAEAGAAGLQARREGDSSVVLTGVAPPIAAARGPPTDWGELVQAHDDRAIFQATDRRAARDRYSKPLTPAGREVSTKSPRGRTRRDSAPTAEKRHCKGSARRSWICCFGTRKTGHSAHEPLSSSESVADVPLAGLSFAEASGMLLAITMRAFARKEPHLLLCQSVGTYFHHFGRRMG